MESQKTILVDDPGVIDATDSHIIIRGLEGSEIKYEIKKIELIICASSGIAPSWPYLRMSSRNGIRTLFLDGTEKPFASIEPANQNGIIADVQKAQLQLSSTRTVQVIKSIIVTKLQNQIGLINYFAKYQRRKNPNDLLKKSVRSIELRQQKILLIPDSLPIRQAREKIFIQEALAAKCYWEVIGYFVTEKINFVCRAPSNKDAFNQMLNLGYHMLFAKLWKAVATVGLNPYFGLLHHRADAPALIFDLAELFRQPIVDHAIISLIRKKKRRIEIGQKINADVYRAVQSNLGKKMKVRGDLMSYEQLIQQEAAKIKGFILAEKTDYHPFVYRWANQY